MLPQKLEIKKGIISEAQPAHHSKSNLKSEVSFQIASKCSCSQCNSIDCFKIRNQNSKLLCTCTNCNDIKTCSISKKKLAFNESEDNDYRDVKDNSERHHQDTLNDTTKSSKSIIDINENIKYSYKNVTLIKDRVKRKEKCYEKSYTRNYSVAMTYSHNEDNIENENPTSKLSAQVMNLPYEEFKDSFSSHKSVTLGINKVIKPDILTKLKEIYKACSCKVCECLTGKPCFEDNYAPQGETCDCEPLGFNKLAHSGCPCISCDRKDCKGVVKTTIEANCECKPCDCVKFSKTFQKPCDCEPCQCAECTLLNFRMPRSIIVAPAQANFQQSLCQCEPCDCVHCTHNYGAMASSLMRETSTSMITQLNCQCQTCLNNACQMDGIDCRCDTQNRIVRKPIERNNRDYDLHRALITESFGQKKSGKFQNCDTIAMFALSNNHSNAVFSKPKGHCQCIECECIVCKDKEKYGIKNSYKDNPTELLTFSNNSFSACNCEPCECQVCGSNVEAENRTLKGTKALNKCGCEICDCMICKGLLYCSDNNSITDQTKNNLKNKPIDLSIKDFTQKISNETCFPLKKGKLLSPSMFEANMHSRSRLKSQSQSSLLTPKKPKLCKSILKVNGKKSSNKTLCPQNITICQTKSLNKYIDGITQSSNQSINQPVMVTISNSNRYNGLSKSVDKSQVTSTAENIFNSRTCNTDSDKIENGQNTVDKDQVTVTEKNILNSKSCETDIKKPFSSCAYLDLSTQKSNNKKGSSDKCIKMEIIDGVTNYTLTKKSSLTSVDKILNETLNPNPNNPANNNNDLLKGHSSSNFQRKIKRKVNSDLFSVRIRNFEKSISQLQEDITQHLKTIAEIRSKDKLLGDNFDTCNIEVNLCDNIITKKSFSSLSNTNTIDSAKPIKFVEFYEEPDKILDLVYEKIDDTVNNAEHLSMTKVNSNSDKNQKSDNFSNGDNKMYSKLIKRTHVNVHNMRKKNVRSSKGNKLSKKSENKINNFINDHLKENSKPKLVLKLSKSTSMINYNESEFHQTKKLQEIDQQPNQEQWSILKKNLYISNTPIRHNKGVCTIPQLEMDVKNAVKSISLQTTETRGYMALSKLQVEVNELLKSPLLQTSYCDKYCKSDVIDILSSHSRPKSKLDLELKCLGTDTSSQTHKRTLTVEKEINCNIGQSREELNQAMVHLLDVILTRTVCKSELTKPFNKEESRIYKINSKKSSCDGLKASFMGLRKVSDHTVLVRWKMPREVADVQGYESTWEHPSFSKSILVQRAKKELTYVKIEKLARFRTPLRVKETLMLIYLKHRPCNNYPN